MSACDSHALTALLFDELPAEEAAAVQRHARHCFGCSRELSGLREDRERLRAPRGELPSFDAIFRGVEARIHAPRIRRSRWELLPGLVPLAGACLALVLAIFAQVARIPVPEQGGGLVDGSAIACWVDPGGSRGDGRSFGLDDEARLSACLIRSPGDPLGAQACF